MLNRPLEGGVRLALAKPGELLAFSQLPAPRLTVGCVVPNRDIDGAAEAALVEAGCDGRLLEGGAKRSGAAAAPEAPAAGRSMQAFPRRRQRPAQTCHKQQIMNCMCGTLGAQRDYSVQDRLVHLSMASGRW